jgi:hypothetical protein
MHHVDPNPNLAIFLSFILSPWKKSLNVWINNLLPAMTWILFLLLLLNNVLLFLFQSSPKSSTSLRLRVFFLNSSKTVQSILFLKNQILIRKVLLSIALSLDHSSFLSKLTERILKHRLMNQLSENNLLNTFQSAHVKSHSTETIHSSRSMTTSSELYESATSHFCLSA